MELKEEVLNALNKQLNVELKSEYLYLSMAAYLELQSLKGMVSWMKLQAEEEKSHAMLIYQHIIDRDGKVSLLSIDAPQNTWESPLDVFESAHRHEIAVTKSIHDLHDLTVSKKDHAAQVMLQWFITEQVEEEASTKEVADNLKRIGSDFGYLVNYDTHLNNRKDEQASQDKEGK
jgi:ferritin